MPKTFATLPLLALIALLSPGKVVAGPPENASGMMVFDEVADGLRKYRKEKDPHKRSEWLKKLAPTRDPRVAVALLEAVKEESLALTEEDILLAAYFIKGTRFQTKSGYWSVEWRKTNEADLRRRASQLPR